jgi:hypothetical protein
MGVLYFVGLVVALVPVSVFADTACYENDSRLLNCDTPLGTRAFTHVEIARANCRVTATVYQPTQSGEPSEVLSAVVTTSPQKEAVVPADDYKGSGIDLLRTDGSGIPADGTFKAHLTTKTISEDLKCYL